jgi:hypothetical protein
VGPSRRSNNDQAVEAAAWISKLWLSANGGPPGVWVRRGSPPPARRPPRTRHPRRPGRPRRRGRVQHGSGDEEADAEDEEQALGLAHGHGVMYALDVRVFSLICQDIRRHRRKLRAHESEKIIPIFNTAEELSMSTLLVPASGSPRTPSWRLQGRRVIEGDKLGLWRS